MEMEVMVPVPVPVLVPVPATAADFNFDSTCSSPYITAPSSPQRFGNFHFSAPTSPTRASSFYRQFNNLDSDIHLHTRSASAIPFNWEEKPGIPKNNDDEEDFAFDFSGQLERTSLSAEELFDGGKIKPLKPPPRLQFSSGGNELEIGIGLNDSTNSKSSVSSPKSPRSRFSQGKKMFKEALSSPRQKNSKDFDPFAAAIEETTRKGGGGGENELNQRGRGRISDSNYVRKGTRSLSPLRVSDITFESKDDNTQSGTTKTNSTSNAVASFLNSFSFSKGYRKWKLKDLLLFRSASEGRATSSGKDPLNKYIALSSKKIAGGGDDVRNSSFRSTESSGSVSSRRRGPASAHELHYTVNRAVSEEMKRKTFLPYRQGLLGCLGFNPTMHEISRGLGSMTRG